MVNYLQCFKKSTIMKYDKSEGLGITNTSYPSAYSNLLIQIFFSLFVNFFYCCQFHIYVSSFSHHSHTFGKKDETLLTLTDVSSFSIDYSPSSRKE